MDEHALDDRHAESRRRIAALEAELAESDDRARRLAEWLDAERERREAAEKDAARYRWLKINARRIDFAGLCVSDGAQLDARIDAAMKD